MKQLALLMLKIYWATQPLRLPRCRFYPSCSHYLAGCIQRHGFGRGVLLGCLRLLRCHPLHPGGIDEVPESAQLMARPSSLIRLVFLKRG